MEHRERRDRGRFSLRRRQNPAPEGVTGYYGLFCYQDQPPPREEIVRLDLFGGGAAPLYSTTTDEVISPVDEGVAAVRTTGKRWRDRWRRGISAQEGLGLAPAGGQIGFEGDDQSRTDFGPDNRPGK